MTQINLRNFNLAQDWWKLGVVLTLSTMLLLAAGYAAERGATVSVNVDIQAQIQEIQERLDAPVNSSLAGMQKPYTEIISMVDAYYVRQNGTDGRLILPYSTNKTYIQQQSLGNVTTGSVYLKEITLASGLTYGSTVLIIQQYQGQLSYYSNNALVYTVKAGSLNATVIYTAILNASTNYVQAYRLLVENGTSFPSSPSSGYLFFRTDLNALYFYNSTGWTACAVGGASVDDDSMYLLSTEASNFLYRNGTQTLTANWNTGAYGIYGSTWMNATQMSATSFYMNGQLIGFLQPYSFLIDYNASSGLYQSWHGANSTLASQSSNASAVINNAIGNVTSGGIYVKSGAYSMTTQIYASGKSNINLIFEKGAVLTAGTNLNLAVIRLASCENWRISGGEIDGNMLNQNAGTSYGSYADGIDLFNCQNVQIDSMAIHNCKIHGIWVAGTSLNVGSSDVRILNNNVTYIGWNGISFDWGNRSLVSGNDVSNCSDVGICSYGSYNVITENFVHDMFPAGIGGDGHNTTWGIALEGSAIYCTISQNKIKYCDAGIYLTDTCDYNTVSDNVILDWHHGTAYQSGIEVRSNFNKIHDNMINSTTSSDGISVDGADYNQIHDNTIIISASSWAIHVQGSSLYNGLTHNWFALGQGILIPAGSNYNRVIDNDMDFCVTDGFSDAGTGTIIGYNIGMDGVYDTSP